MSRWLLAVVGLILGAAFISAPTVIVKWIVVVGLLLSAH